MRTRQGEDTEQIIEAMIWAMGEQGKQVKTGKERVRKKQVKDRGTRKAGREMEGGKEGEGELRKQ